MPERNNVTLIARGDLLPAITATLKDTAENPIVFDITAGDTVEFYAVNARTNALLVDWTPGTIVSAATGSVKYSWTAGQTDASPGSLFNALFRVVRGSGAKWTQPEPFLIGIWAPIVSEPYFFAPVSAIKAFLDIRDNTRDDVVRVIGAAATASLEGELGYPIISRTFRYDGTDFDRLDGSGSNRIKLPVPNVTSLTSIAIEDEETINVSDREVVRLNRSTGEVYLMNRVFSFGFQNVETVFVAGWKNSSDATPTIPNDVVLVGLELCGRKFQEWPRKGPQTERLVVGGEMIEVPPPDLTAEQRRTLSRYRRYSF